MPLLAVKVACGRPSLVLRVLLGTTLPPCMLLVEVEAQGSAMQPADSLRTASCTAEIERFGKQVLM